MGRPVRKPFQGVSNIIRFNWHYYVLAYVLILVLIFLSLNLDYWLFMTITVFTGAVVLSVLISLSVSYYVYDKSDLYSLRWLTKLPIDNNSVLVNINAGFDETSAIIAYKYPQNKLVVFDFYNPQKHTELSIERARKAYPPYPDTQTITTTKIPVADGSIDYVFLIMSAHEIRDKQERIDFFNHIHTKLSSNGRVVVVEHQRDLPNFLAFNFGFFHFYSSANWLNIFNKSGFKIEEKIKQTPFVSTYILAKNGASS